MHALFGIIRNDLVFAYMSALTLFIRMDPQGLKNQRPCSCDTWTSGKKINLDADHQNFQKLFSRFGKTRFLNFYVFFRRGLFFFLNMGKIRVFNRNPIFSGKSDQKARARAHGKQTLTIKCKSLQLDLRSCELCSWPGMTCLCSYLSSNCASDAGWDPPVMWTLVYKPF